MSIYPIFAAINLYLWSGLALKLKDNEPIFFFLHAFDYEYTNVSKQSCPPNVWKFIEDITDTFLTSSSQNYAWKIDIALHCAYLIYSRKDKTPENIFLNFILTFHAFEQAVYFHIWKEYHSQVYAREIDEILLLTKLFNYMDWFFSFMFEEKVNDFCELNSISSFNLKATYKAAYICNIMKTLNLDFIRQKKYLEPYEADKPYDVFSKSVESKPGFIILEDNNEEDNEDKYNYIWNTISESYSEHFQELLGYLRTVISGKCFKKVNPKEKLKPDFNFYLRGMKHLKEFRNIIERQPTEGIIISDSSEDAIVRSKASDIMRLMDTIFVDHDPQIEEFKKKLLIFHKRGIGTPIFLIMPASESSYVDYVVTPYPKQDE